jgi:hypothetical protein
VFLGGGGGGGGGGLGGGGGGGGRPPHAPDGLKTWWAQMETIEL